MAHTPDDPTKAQVWVTKGLDDLDFEFYIPQGPKGDAGPFVNTVIAADTNLNDITTFGVYSCTVSSTSASSLLANLPVHIAGSLTVTGSGTGSTKIQMYITNTENFYIRRLFSGSWSAWRSYAKSRVDQTAGRVIYQWDDINAREQLIYGDTGRRNITPSFPVPVAGAVYLSRSGQYANLIFADYQDGSSAGTLSIPANTIPAGFRPQNWLYQPAASARLLVIKADGGLTMNSHSATVWQGAFTWRTEDAWPTTLPGTAVGTIPAI